MPASDQPEYPVHQRIRLGLIGGGGDALIGPVHRIAARMDDRFLLAAAVLSSRPDRAVVQAEALGMRGYPDVPAMLTAEAARPDGIEAVAIMTPNGSHAELTELALRGGLDVICDKPLTNDVDSARSLARLAAEKGLILTLMHNYSGYPMVREGRAAVAAGEIGPVRVVHVSYVQGSLGTLVEADLGAVPNRLRWRLDPDIGGASHVLGDIGTHAHQLLSYVTGSRVAAVLADVGAALPGRTAHDTASVILRMENGARGVLFVTKAATGAENAVSLEVYGEAGGLEWQQVAANELRVMRHNKSAELRTRGLPTLHPLAKRAVRLPPGHPEAFLEAFANVYRDFADLVLARRTGAVADKLAQEGPDAATGVAGLVFINACLRSAQDGRWVDCLDG